MKNKINLFTYKNGEFKGTETIKFNTEKELKNWINQSIEYTKETKSKEMECGETLCKYHGTFQLNGIEHNVYLDC